MTLESSIQREDYPPSLSFLSNSHPGQEKPQGGFFLWRFRQRCDPRKAFNFVHLGFVRAPCGPQVCLIALFGARITCSCITSVGVWSLYSEGRQIR